MKVRAYFYIAFVGFVGSMSAAPGASQTTSKTAVTTCAGAGSTCAATVNKIGDTIQIDLSKTKVTDFGAIVANKTVTVDLPQLVKTQKVYSFTPSEGESASKRIYFMFDNQEQKLGTRLAGKTGIKAYRQILGEPNNEWTEVGRIETDAKKLIAPSITLKADGTAVWINPVNGKDVVFQLGKSKL